MPHALVTLPGLRRQVELRQLTVSDLAHSAGVTWVTARRAIEGQPISVSAFRRIVEALNHIPVDPVAALALGCDPAELAQITQMSPPQPIRRRVRRQIA